MGNLKPVLAFLSALKRHNNRPWFAKHKEDYESARRIFEDFIFEVIQRVQEFDDTIGHPEPKDCIFRIYKDVRFSKDKAPYKTNFGAVIAQGGRKTQKACYYVQISPGDHMLGGGIYLPPPDQLKRLRGHVLERADELHRILSAKAFQRYFGGMWEEDKLVRPPKGFDVDDPNIELAKHKHFVVSHSLSDKDVLSGDIVKKVGDGFRMMKTFNRFLNEAL